MAMARCDDHKPGPDDPEYHAYALPVGYPTSAVTCDIVGCAMPARVWLSKDERKSFAAGERTFVAGGAPVRLSDDLFPD